MANMQKYTISKHLMLILNFLKKDMVGVRLLNFKTSNVNLKHVRSYPSAFSDFISKHLMLILNEFAERAREQRFARNFKTSNVNLKPKL